MATERYEIVISQTGAANVTRSIADIGRASERTTSLLGFLRQALVIYASLKFADIFFKFADSLVLMQNKLALATSTAAEAQAVFRELVDVANRSRTSLTDTVDLYSRLARSTKDLGLSQRQTIAITEALNKTIAISGATTAEGKNALIQFGQALASNRLGGDELRSVMENLPVLVEQLRKGLVGIIPGFKGTLGEFRELSKQGKLTGDVLLQALGKQLPEINRLFAQTTPTIAQGFSRLSTAATVFASSMNESTQFTTRFARGLIVVAENFDKVAAGVIILSGAIFARLVPALLAASAASARFLLSLLPLAAIGAVFAAIAFGPEAVGNALDDLFGKITPFAGSMATLGDSFVGIFNSARQAIRELLADVREFLETLDELAPWLRGRSLKSSDIKPGVYQDPVLGERPIPPGYEMRGGELVQKEAPGSEYLAPPGPTGLDRARERAAMLRRLREQDAANLADNSLVDLDRPGTRTSVPTTGKRSGAVDSYTQFLSKQNAELTKQAELLAIIDPQERKIAETQLNISKAFESLSPKVKAANAARLKDDEANLLQRARELEDLKRLSAARAESYEKARGPARDYALAIEAVNRNLRDGLITQAESTRQLRDARIAYLDTQKDISSGVERFFLKAGRDAEDLATQIEGALTNAFKAAEDALVDFLTTGQFNFKKFIDALLADIARLAVKSLVSEGLGFLKTLLKIGGSVGGAGGYDIAGGADTGTAFEFHGGGTVGHDGVRRTVAADLFAGARRFHNGLAPDEFPAILQRGEEVTAARDVGRRGNVVTIAPSVTVVVQGDASKDDAETIAIRVKREMSSLIDERIVEQMRVGNALNPV